MAIEEQRKLPSLHLPGLESRVLPGGTEIHARPGELEFVERIVGMGIRLDPSPAVEVRRIAKDLKGNL